MVLVSPLFFIKKTTAILTHDLQNWNRQFFRISENCPTLVSTCHKERLRLLERIFCDICPGFWGKNHQFLKIKLDLFFPTFPIVVQIGGYFPYHFFNILTDSTNLFPCNAKFLFRCSHMMQNKKNQREKKSLVRR